ncbi:DUF6517 family protein [Halosolutus amylolyticus]|uniref:DUF6517 family protein n=1 Tax=Halosolutus amylolyticus TaxID=2932267 RepID=A0ABD5PQI4_9EURY|nr:DUF6517 family protein [Halosolutus amylolyticus]
MNRRTVLAGAGSIGLASLAGCLGLAGLDTHESAPAGVEAGVREDTGYEQTGIEPIEITESFEVGPYSETITVTNYLTEHEKAVDMGPIGDARGAVFMLLTTPQVSIAGREFNPVEEMTTTELVELVEDNYDGIDDISHEEDETVTILDQETTMSRFTASAEFEGHPVDVSLHATEAVETESDLLVAIGVYPQRVRTVEESNVKDLAAGVVEDADESASTGGADDGDNDEEGDDDGSGDDATDDNETDEEDDDGLVSISSVR